MQRVCPQADSKTLLSSARRPLRGPVARSCFGRLGRRARAICNPSREEWNPRQGRGQGGRGSLPMIPPRELSPPAEEGPHVTGRVLLAPGRGLCYGGGGFWAQV